jgi:hypothetical protein
MSLPKELLHAIVDILALPTHPQAYGFEADVLRSLVRLCSSSTTLCSITSPYLYSSVIISSAKQLNSFVHTLRNTKGRLSHALRSLSLQEFDGASRGPYASDLSGLLALLHEYSPNLRRLIIDSYLWTWMDPIESTSTVLLDEESPEISGIERGAITRQRSDICSALGALYGLEELGSIQDEMLLKSVGTNGNWHYNSGWKDYLQLRYLSLYSPFIDWNLGRGITALTFLECLVLVQPDVVDDCPVDFFQTLTARRRVILVGPLLPIEIDTIKEAVTAVRPKYEVVYVEPQVRGEDDEMIRDVQLWVRQRLESGTMFDAEGTLIWRRHESPGDIHT